MISSHTCRRSFATNLYPYLAVGDIMHVTGHSSEKQLLEYIHTKPIEVSKRVWDVMSKL